MTLHGLHYAIMKAFGWQNSHLHNFAAYEDEKERYKTWARSLGWNGRMPKPENML